jgi:uncharacterized protein
MLRLIVLLVITALVFGGILRMLARVRRDGGRIHAAPARMVRCAHCDLYLPQEEALRQGEDYYCGEEHRLRGPRTGNV